MVEFLKRSTVTQKLTYPKLAKLLQPRFSEQGSNTRTLEDATYRNFLNYMKEVAGNCNYNCLVIINVFFKSHIFCQT